MLFEKAVAAGMARILEGDVRTIPANGSAHLIDFDHRTTGFFLVMALASRSQRWNLRIGIQRAQLGEEIDATTDLFVRVVACSSISLTSQDFLGGVTPQTIRAVVVPIEPNLQDVQTFINATGLGSGFGIVNPFLIAAGASTFGVAVNVASVSLTGANITARGWTVVNFSPAGANLYLRLGATNASIASSGFTVRLVPNAYYETPFGYVGPMQGIWDAADGAGFANITAV